MRLSPAVCRCDAIRLGTSATPKLMRGASGSDQIQTIVRLPFVISELIFETAARLVA